MASLAQFRKKHPEYADVSDKDLVNALHAKYYADVPIADFYKTMGIQSAPTKIQTLFGASEKPNAVQRIMDASTKPLEAGMRQGFGDVIATGATPFLAVKDKLQPKGLANLITNPNNLSSAERFRQDMYRRNTEGIDPNDPAFKLGRFGTNVIATLPVGGALGAGVKALGATKLGTAIGTGGLTSITEAGAPLTQRVLDLGTRTLGGAINAGVTAGAVDPENTMQAAGIGAALPAVVGAVKFPIKFAMEASGPMRETWRTARGREMFKNWLGGKQAEVGRTINTAAGDYLPGSPMTTADLLAAANVGKTNKIGSGLVGLEDYLQNVPEAGISDVAKGIKATQQAGREQAIGSIAGTPVLRDAAERARRAITAPMREETFARADVGEQIPKVLNPLKAANEAAATEAVGDVRRFTAAGERAKDLSKTWTSSVDKAEGVVRRPIQYTYPGQLAGKAEEVAQGAADQSLVSGNLAKVNQAQLENLRALGIKPIDLNGFISKIEQLKNEPGSSAVTEIQNLLQRIQNKAQELVQRGGGVANVRDIDAIRKSELSNIVNELANAKGLGGDKTHMAGVVGKLKDDLVNIIDESAGGGYRNYLQTFSNLSKPINEMEVGSGLQAALRPPTGAENPTAFLQEVKRLETEIDPETGIALIHKLSPQAKERMYQTANELQRDVERGGLSQGVVIRDSEEALKKGAALPGLISQAVSTGNFIAKRLAEKAAGKLNEDIAMKMLTDPAGFAAKYLADLPPDARQIAIDTAMEALTQTARVAAPLEVVNNQREQQQRLEELSTQ